MSERQFVYGSAIDAAKLLIREDDTSRYADIISDAIDQSTASLTDQLAAARRDTERLDWLERHGDGANLIHDDHSRWACCLGGVQPVTDGDTDITQQPIGGAWTYFAEPEDWKPTIRAAIDQARQSLGGKGEKA